MDKSFNARLLQPAKLARCLIRRGERAESGAGPWPGGSPGSPGWWEMRRRPPRQPSRPTQNCLKPLKKKKKAIKTNWLMRPRTSVTLCLNPVPSGGVLLPRNWLHPETLNFRSCRFQGGGMPSSSAGELEHRAAKSWGESRLQNVHFSQVNDRDSLSVL